MSAAGALPLACLWLLTAPAGWAAETGAPGASEPAAEEVRIRPKKAARAPQASHSRLLSPDTNLIDAPTTAVLDYGGYSATTRFFTDGGVLQHVGFGVYPRLNLGASLNVDKLVGSAKPTRVRAPSVQVKYRFYDGEHWIPSLAVGFDGQGWRYNPVAKRYNHRHRGFYLAATQELGLPGLEVHPSFNISDFDSNSIFAALPLSYNIRDRLSLMAEWDNINDLAFSRANSGLRVYITPALHLDFAVRAMGMGGRFDDNTPRGPERVVQLKYTGSF